jgi:diacylglycerol kinase family enzyme
MSSRKIMNNWEKKIDEKYHNLEDTLDNEPVEVIANKNFNNEEFFFYTILTHEAASSVEYQWYAPFTRINDGEVYLIGVHKLNKTELSKFTWMLNKGIHYKHQKVTIEKASEFKIKNPPGTQFWLDGEIYQSDELIIRSMPGALSLLGTVTRFPKLMDEFRQSISC